MDWTRSSPGRSPSVTGHRISTPSDCFPSRPPTAPPSTECPRSNKASISGVASCARISMADIRQRRGDIPAALFDGGQPKRHAHHRGDTVIVDQRTQPASSPPAQPPTLQMEVSCGSGPATYCRDNSTVEVDISALDQIGTPAWRKPESPSPRRQLGDFSGDIALHAGSAKTAGRRGGRSGRSDAAPHV